MEGATLEGPPILSRCPHHRHRPGLCCLHPRPDNVITVLYFVLLVLAGGIPQAPVRSGALTAALDDDEEAVTSVMVQVLEQNAAVALSLLA